MSKKWKRFWNKRNLLQKLYEEYPDINFELTVFITGEKYILLWEYNDKDKNLFDNISEFENKTKEISNKIIEISQNLKISYKKAIPLIETQHKLLYEIFLSNIKGININYIPIKFPYQETISNAECIIRELLNTIFNNYINIMLKGSTSAYICYGIGDNIPLDINISCLNFEIIKIIEIIKNYCKMNKLSYKTNFNSKDNISKTNLTKRYITIKDYITFTFDNTIEFYGIPEVSLDIKNNILTYTLETLVIIKKTKLKKQHKIMSKKEKLKEIELLNKYEEKLKEINNKKGE